MHRESVSAGSPSIGPTGIVAGMAAEGLTVKDALLPRLNVSGPDGQESMITLQGKRLTIGRLPEVNDLALEPDPQHLITRQVHCLVEHDDGTWWILDNGSVNGTFLQRSGATQAVRGRSPLIDGDVIRVLGRLSDDGSPAYWDLVFQDPMKTQPAGPQVHRSHLSYDWIQAKLYLIDGSAQHPIVVRPQVHKLVRHMVQRNADNNNVPVLCTHDELIEAVWGEEPGHTQVELAGLIRDLRREIEKLATEPQIIQTERGLGYRLRTTL